MAWLRSPGEFASDPVILNICRNQSEKTRVLGYTFELQLYAANHLTNGYIPGIIFRDVVRSKRWRELLTAPPGGGTPIVHARGDKCECMPHTVDWPDTAADFYMHHYLASNPTREEHDVQKAKAAELRDAELRAAVRHRDQGRCRYCAIRVRWQDRRSSQGGVIDHVDPTLAAGAANLVVSCRGCNSRKGNRTPDAAGMTLLPVPGSETDPEPLQETDPGATTHAPVRDGTGRLTALPGPDPGDHPHHGRPPPAGDAGVAGYRPTVGPPTMPRTSRDPNPYLRTAITGLAPDDNAGIPDPYALDQADRDITYERTEGDHPYG